MELGIGIAELDLLTIGLIMDMFVERGNDYAEDEPQEKDATQADFDRF